MSAGERGRLLLRCAGAALRLLDQAIGCGLHAVREERRGDAHEENREGDGDENESFTAGGVGQRAIFFVGELAERDALVGPQQINRGKDRAAGGPGSPRVVILENADQNEKLADEAVQRRQRSDERHTSRKNAISTGMGFTNPPNSLNLVGVTAIINHAEAEEEAPVETPWLIIWKIAP